MASFHLGSAVRVWMLAVLVPAAVVRSDAAPSHDELSSSSSSRIQLSVKVQPAAPSSSRSRARDAGGGGGGGTSTGSRGSSSGGAADSTRQSAAPSGASGGAGGQCDTLCELQASVLQLVGTQLDYGRGLHAVYGLVDVLRKDMTLLRSEIELVCDRRTNAVASSKHTFDPPPATTLSPLMTSSLTGNWTSTIVHHTSRLASLDRRSKRLQRAIDDVNKNVAKMATAAERYTSTSKQCAAFVEQLAANQKDINANVLRKLHALEKNVETKLLSNHPHHPSSATWPQGDSPAGMTSSNRLTGGCPAGYWRHLSSCYRFENTTKNWIDAEKYCQTTYPDSHLISIETKAEMDLVIAYRNHNNARWSSRYIWTGANDMSSEGRWTWVGTGRTVDGDGSYTDWLPGQPDNHNGDQHCVYARADGQPITRHNRSGRTPDSIGGCWDDWHCHAAKLNFVCEMVARD